MPKYKVFLFYRATHSVEVEADTPEDAASFAHGTQANPADLNIPAPYDSAVESEDGELLIPSMSESEASAYESALDDIAKACGFGTRWGYAGQIVRDVWDRMAQLCVLQTHFRLTNQQMPPVTAQRAVPHNHARIAERADDMRKRWSPPSNPETIVRGTAFILPFVLKEFAGQLKPWEGDPHLTTLRQRVIRLLRVIEKHIEPSGLTPAGAAECLQQLIGDDE